MPNIISRKDAKAYGLVRYFTGKPCKHGHVAERHTCNSSCVDCGKIKNENQKEYKNQWYRENEKLTKDRANGYYQNNKEKVINYQKEYYKEKYREKRDYQNQYYSNKYYNDPIFNLHLRLKAAIRAGLKSVNGTRSARTEEILGCSWQEFRSHMESKFTDGMGWHNMDEWHIDHIIPKSLAKNEDDVIKLNHFTNLQPLWAADNLKKSNKVSA